MENRICKSYTNPDNYLEDFLEEHLNFSQSDHEVRAVRKLVYEMVNNIAKEAYPPESVFTVREIIPVGSMAEETRIIQPNEFDFMIVLDKFGADRIKRTWLDQDGIYCELNREFREENSPDACEESDPLPGDLSTKVKHCCTSRLSISKGVDMRQITRRRLLDCKSYLASPYVGTPQTNDPLPDGLSMTTKLERCHNSFSFYNAIFRLEYAWRKMVDCRSCLAEPHLGTLRMKEFSVNFHKHVTTFRFLWGGHGAMCDGETMEISVDLAPVVEIEINEFFLDGFDVFHQHFYNKLKATNKVHMMTDSTRADVFRVSFAFTEVQLLQDESETHRKCYKILKYIYRTNATSMCHDFSSFALKNLVLQHAVCCEGGGLGSCLLKILGDLKDRLDRSEMPVITHIFCTQKHLVNLNARSADHWITDQGERVQQDLRTYHKNKLSELIEILEKVRHGSPIPRLFQFQISNHYNVSPDGESEN